MRLVSLANPGKTAIGHHRSSGSNGIDLPAVSLLRTKPILGAKGIQHRVVDIQSLRSNVHDLAGLETTVGAGDAMENSRQLSLHIVVATISRFGRMVINEFSRIVRPFGSRHSSLSKALRK